MCGASPGRRTGTAGALKKRCSNEHCGFESHPGHLPTGRWTLLTRAVLIGALVSVVFVGFEWVVNHGTDFVWNDVFGTDDERWRVVPLAIGASILFSLLLGAQAAACRRRAHGSAGGRRGSPTRD